MSMSRNFGSVVANVLLVLVFMLGAGATHAQQETVILDSSGNVVRIENLTVINAAEQSILISVR